MARSGRWCCEEGTIYRAPTPEIEAAARHERYGSTEVVHFHLGFAVSFLRWRLGGARVLRRIQIVYE